MTSPVLEALISARVADIVDPPRSWTKDAKVLFLQLPRDLQLYYAKREQERDRVVSQAHQEAALARKAAQLADKAAKEWRALVDELETKLANVEAKLARIEEKNAEAKDTDGTDQANSARV